MCVFCEVFQPGHCVMVESCCLGGRERFKEIAWEEVRRIRVLWWSLISVPLHARQKGETPNYWVMTYYKVNQTFTLPK